MNYEVVNLEEKIVVGVSAITSNADPKMGEIIGGLWEKLYQGGVNATIKNKANQYAIGLYSDYSKDTYCVTAGNEVSKAENQELTVKIIPAGRYAKFSVHGHMEKAVAEAWNEIWKMDLDRSFTGDFEEYLNSDWENANIDIYIALK
ncbi:Predicted transcriptional regulator YdeE, contains AraC-type DNA-binding domain [Natronincola peptidivorans]|uniref:Predicted transcriptional regulator YdeE, contains AraC-type DNA-binding domain n=1 Tax=Natronincola peptidivorans TaxID=426128 RepID=A0A1I0DCC2_9FIRM|nr:GyrI-like domain-containing protein [Natronincola peptidivorans]SET29892.1 Predicted transcriptional regulator YdeE, contains AraC-type DNA-binding domain [Natronincola peptidivorans]